MPHAANEFHTTDPKLASQLEEFPAEFVEAVDTSVERIFSEYQSFTTYHASEKVGVAYQAQQTYFSSRYQYVSVRKDRTIPATQKATYEHEVAQARQAYIRARNELLQYIWHIIQQEK